MAKGGPDPIRDPRGLATRAAVDKDMWKEIDYSPVAPYTRKGGEPFHLANKEEYIFYHWTRD